MPGSDLSAHAGVRRVRNYARGGGSSGGVLIDAGACTTRQTSSCEMTGAGLSAIAVESTARGAHGAMPLQFAGAHGVRQGSGRFPDGLVASDSASRALDVRVEPIATIAEDVPLTIPGIPAGNAHPAPPARTSS